MATLARKMHVLFFKGKTKSKDIFRTDPHHFRYGSHFTKHENDVRILLRYGGTAANVRRVSLTFGLIALPRLEEKETFRSGHLQS